MTKRFMVAAVFLAGCAVGGVSGQLVVPKASAQQAATLTRWEYVAAEIDGGDDDAVKVAASLGREGWEWTGEVQYHGSTYAWFKRPKL